MQYRPMLCQIGDNSVLTKSNFIFEPKIDGTRVFVYKEGNKIKLFNRKGIDITSIYPEFKDISKNIHADACILDAELAILDNKGMPDFDKLQEREEKKDKEKSKISAATATLFVFDILQIDHVEMTDMLLERRKARLKEIISESPLIQLISCSESGTELWKRITELGLEGVIAKDTRSKYEQKRSYFWLKIKNLNTIDAMIIGYIKSKKREFASLILGCYNDKDRLVYIGRVGTGFSSAILKELSAKTKNLVSSTPLSSTELEKALIKLYSGKEKITAKDIVWTNPELIVEVKSSGIVNKEIKSSSFMRLRYDKNPEDCIIS
jgi:bifunctional non-homologous end joining protein LigD